MSGQKQLLERLLVARRADADAAAPRVVDEVSAEELASRLLVWQPDGWDAYCKCLAELELALYSAPSATSLLIVDSIAAPVRAQFGAREQLTARQEKLVAHAALFKYLSEAHNLCVLVTNQVQGVGERAAAA